MAAQRVLLLGAGDLTEETGEALAAAGADVTHLEDPGRESLAEALEAGADAVAVVSRDDAWPLRVVLLVRHLDADVPIVATISDRAVGRRLEAELGRSTIVSIAEIVAPSLAGPCLADELAAVFDGDPPQGLTCRDGDARPAPLPEVRRRRARALATAVLKPFDHSAGLVFFGAVGLLTILVLETVAAALVLEQAAVDSFYGAVKTLVTVDPNPQVQDGPKWFKVVISLSMLVALLFAAAFTGGLVERLIGRNLTGLRRAPCRAPLGSRRGRRARAGRPARCACCCGAAGCPSLPWTTRRTARTSAARAELGLPVVIGRGADPSLLGRLSLGHAHALAAVTADDLQNIAVVLAARTHASDLRIVLRAGGGATRGETRSLERLGHVRDVHRIGAVYLAGLALGSAAEHVVVDGDTAHLRDGDGALEPCPYPVAG